MPTTSLRSSARLEALRRTGLLDARAEPAFDRFTSLAARLLNAPAALLNAVDADQIWIKGSAGDAVVDAEQPIPVGQTFCRLVVERGEPMILEDAQADPANRQMPLVSRLNIRGCITVPLRMVDGHVVGTLSAIDHRPRAWTAGDVAALTELAELVNVELERRAARTQLNATAHAYQQLFDANPVPVLVYDTDTLQFLAVNQAALREYGYTREEFLRLRLTDIHPPEEVPRLLEAIRAPNWVPGRWKEFKHRAKDGRVFEVEILSHGITYEGRDARVVIALDVAERAATQAELQRQTRILQAVLDSLADGVAVADEHGQLVLFNPAAQQILGRPRLDGTPDQWAVLYQLHDINDQALLPHDQLPLVRALRGESCDNVELMAHRPDGTRVPLSVNARPVRDRGGRVLGAVAVFHDIATRRAAEIALRYSEQRYRTLVESAPYGVVLHAGDVIEFANPVLARMIGVPDASELVGRSVMEFVHPDSRGEVEQRVARLLATGTPTTPTPQRLVRADGTTFEAETYSVLLTLEGRRAVQTLVLDLTEKRTLEAQLLQAQRMEAVGRFAGGIAHDFNNLLTAILSYSDMMLSELRPEDPLREDLQQIHRAGERAASLTRQLLAFSRRQVLRPSVLDLNAVITDLQRML
ncbi:MAG: PAS domain S-box protein, partial [Gemmatimonadota bacterium]